MTNEIKNIHPEPYDELCHMLGRWAPLDNNIPNEMLANPKSYPPDEEEYERIFHKKIPDSWLIGRWYEELGFENCWHLIAYCIYHNISMEELAGEEFSYPPEDMKVFY